jgi:hypothetical protein
VHGGGRATQPAAAGRAARRRRWRPVPLTARLSAQAALGWLQPAAGAEVACALYCQLTAAGSAAPGGGGCLDGWRLELPPGEGGLHRAPPPSSYMPADAASEQALPCAAPPSAAGVGAQLAAQGEPAVSILGSVPYWLRFTYATPVLVKKC